MKWKIFIGMLTLLFTCSCAGMFAEHTAVEVYNPKTGKLIGKAYSNKGYDGFKCTVKFTEDGTGKLTWTASKVNSATVAQSVADSNKILSQSLAHAIGAATGIAIPIK